MALRATISSVPALVIWSSVAATLDKSTFPITLTKPACNGPFPGVVTLATIVDKPEIGKRTDTPLVAAVALDPACWRIFGTWSVERSRALGRPIAGYCLQADCTLADPDRGTRRLDAGRAQPQTGRRLSGRDQGVPRRPSFFRQHLTRAPCGRSNQRPFRNWTRGDHRSNTEAWADAIQEVARILVQHAR